MEKPRKIVYQLQEDDEDSEVEPLTMTPIKERPRSPQSIHRPGERNE